MIPDSVAVVLLLVLLTALYALWARRGEYEQGYMAGYQHATQKWLQAVTAPKDARDLTTRPYDWAKDGA